MNIFAFLKKSITSCRIAEGGRRSKVEIISDIKELDENAADYGVRVSALVKEYTYWFRKDREELSLLMKLPCRPKLNLTDDDLIDMAEVVETMRLSAIVAVSAILDGDESDSLELAVSQMQYQADYLRYVGYDVCDFPMAFKWASPGVARLVIQEWQKSGLSRQDIFKKATDGFSELAMIVKRPVLNRYGVVNQREDAFWRYVPQSIQRVAMGLFVEGYYAESVEAALKEINIRVKSEFRKRTGQEADGADLMKKAFSPSAKVIELSQSETAETRKSEQQGYMELFSGAMSALRNPKAHANVRLEKEDAVRQLVFSGMLLSKFETCVGAAAERAIVRELALMGNEMQG